MTKADSFCLPNRLCVFFLDPQLPSLYSVSVQSKDAVAWAAVLMQGELILPADRTAAEERPARVALRVEGATNKKVFDALGKYFIVTLDESKDATYPLIPVPFYMPDGETWDGRLVLGTDISIDPENFQRLRSFGENRNAAKMEEEATIALHPCSAVE